MKVCEFFARYSLLHLDVQHVREKIMSGLTYTTTCPFCAKTFHHAAVATMLQHGTLDNQGQKLIQDFSKHLFEKHAEQWAREVITLPGLMSTMCLFKVFMRTTQDQTIGQLVDWIRHQLHDFVGFHVPDQKLMGRIAELGLDPEYSVAVFESMKTLRDVLEERPPFVPKQPGKATDESSATATPAKLSIVQG